MDQCLFWLIMWFLKSRWLLVPTIGVFDLKRCCAEWSVYDIKLPREWFESIRICLLSYRSRGTLMSYTDHSAQRCFKSNTPIVSLALKMVNMWPKCLPCFFSKSLTLLSSRLCLFIFESVQTFFKYFSFLVYAPRLDCFEGAVSLWLFFYYHCWNHETIFKGFFNKQKVQKNSNYLK